MLPWNINDKKQRIIEDKLDSICEFDKGFFALVALQAYRVFTEAKVNDFIMEFSSDLGFTNHYDTAKRIMVYCFPENTEAWKTWVGIYTQDIKDSVFLKANKPVE